MFFFFFFFFQAEDGIRDVAVTGVQTCALPIFDFKTVKIFEAAQFQTGGPEMVEVHKCLLHESIGHIGVVVVRCVVVPTKAELALGSRHHGVVRQAKNGWLLPFQEPTEAFPTLPDSHSQQGIPQSVITVSRLALEPNPTFRAGAPVDRNLKRANFVLWRHNRFLLLCRRWFSGWCLLPKHRSSHKNAG